MPISELEPTNPREFALDVVERLRFSGFDSLWAGGCVRDQLLGITPKDYDVATNATPQQVIELFGKRRTVPVGVSFGVVMVLGPTRACGQVEVATFRADGEYLDGRRPSGVTFCSAEEDAKRRDFTINGMFYDPVSDNVLDYVGGREDLEAGVIRAIGDPAARFAEDKLRMLRAVRFASTYKFELEPLTASAIRDLRRELNQVSAERIAAELRRMLAHQTRAVSVWKLGEVGLLGVIFPEIFGEEDGSTCDNACRVLRHLSQARFEPSLAVLLMARFDEDRPTAPLRTAGIRKECSKLKMSNQESSCVGWIADNATRFGTPADLPLHVIKPVLADPRHALLLDVVRAKALAEGIVPDAADFLEDYLRATPPDMLNPAPLIDGADLKEMGIEPGPAFKQILTRIRQEQLDEQLTERGAAMQRAQELLTDD